jgi:hypothetical protein
MGINEYLGQKIQQQFKTATDQLDQINNEKAFVKKNPLRYPSFSSGSRTFIQVGGKNIAVALEFSYSITAETEEIRTIDSSFPWDIAINQVKITGTMRKIVDPESSFEAEGLFHTMQSIVHQPYVEILVQDANGYAQFFARGMFTSVQSAFVKGQLTTRSANFVGVAYQHWAYQEFTPYPPETALSKAAKSLKKISGALGKFGF